MKESSLEEFLGSGDDSEEKDSPLADVEPATVTSRWVREGQSCDDCERTVDRLWNDDDRDVCRECKDWS